MSMDIITERDMIRRMPKVWREQYPKNMVLHNGRQSNDILRELLALDIETATQEDIGRITGCSTNGSLTCNICKRQVKKVVRFGENPPQYDYDTIDVCQECLAKAVVMLDNVT